MSQYPSRLRSVSRSQPCLVCGGDHKCSTTGTLHLCGRRSGPEPGFRHLGPCKDPTWHKYVEDDDGFDSDPDDFYAKPSPKSPEATGPVDYGRRLQALYAQLGVHAAVELAENLDLPHGVLYTLPVGYNLSSNGPEWVFPERDGEGKVIGLLRRYRGGAKRNQGCRGLTIPKDWQSRPGPLFCPEGASDTLALTALGLAAVGRPNNHGGLDHLAQLLKHLPEDREICIVGENDEKPDGTRPGRDGAIQTARSLAERLERDVNRALPPEGHKDVRAWAAARASRGIMTNADQWEVAGVELRKLLEAATRPADAGLLFAADPRPLEQPAEAPPFPLRTLPSPLQVFVEEASEALGCPRDYVGVAVLALGGAALGNAWRLHVHKSHSQSAALFCALVGPPGTLKSPALSLVGEPLHEANGAWLDDFHRCREQQELENSKRPPAPPRRCVVDDFTTESLTPILLANPKGVAVVKDELSGLIYGLNQYKGGRGSDRQVLLSIWSGSPYVVDRKSGPGPAQVRQPFAAILGGIQPAVLDALRARARDLVVDDGLIDRFLFCYPEPPPAREESWRELSDPARAAWRASVRRLLDVAVPAGKDDVCRPLVVKLSPDARGGWEAFVRRHVAEVNAEDFPMELHGVWSKMRGYAGRLALVLHALDCASGEYEGPVDTVSGGCLERAGRLVEYFKAHSRKVYSALQADPTLESARRVLEWLRRRPQARNFVRSELHASMRRHHPKAEQLDKPLALLVEMGYLMELAGWKGRRWQVNPRWQRQAG